MSVETHENMENIYDNWNDAKCKIYEAISLIDEAVDILDKTAENANMDDYYKWDSCLSAYKKDINRILNNLKKSQERHDYIIGTQYDADETARILHLDKGE